MDTRIYCDTCVVTQRCHNVLHRLWHRDTYDAQRYTGHDRCYVLRYVSRYLGRDTICVSPTQVSRCIDIAMHRTLRPYTALYFIWHVVRHEFAGHLGTDSVECPTQDSLHCIPRQGDLQCYTYRSIADS